MSNYIDLALTKVCYVCKETKTIADFYSASSNLDNHSGKCKSCALLWHKNDRCQNPEKYRLREIQRNRNSRPHYEWARATIYGHRRNGIDVRISCAQLTAMAKSAINCPLCSARLLWTYGNKNGRPSRASPSLDRINNDSFIDENNVMIICHLCNSGKSTLSLREFVSHCQRIATNASTGLLSIAVSDTEQRELFNIEKGGRMARPYVCAYGQGKFGSETTRESEAIS